MPRSRSRSPRRERRRSKERRRHRKSRSRSPGRHRSRSPRRRSRDRYRSRSRSPARHRDRKERDHGHGSDRLKSHDGDGYEIRPPAHHGANTNYVQDNEVYEIEDDDEDDVMDEASALKSEAAMLKAMGFSTFSTTKGKKVEGNDIYVANTARKRRYRQYMNRRGGFNRPLDFIA